MVRDDQPDAREGQTGTLGWRRGSLYRGSRVMPVEGRDLSSMTDAIRSEGPGDWAT